MTPLESARAAVAIAAGEMAEWQVVADATLAVANTSLRACRVALQAGAALELAQRHLAAMRRALPAAEYADARSTEQSRLAAEQASEPALTDAERMNLRAIVPATRTDGRRPPLLVPPGIDHGVWVLACSQAAQDSREAWIEQPVRGVLAWKLRKVLETYASKFTAPPVDGAGHREVRT
jgi:hypothetical protein